MKISFMESLIFFFFLMQSNKRNIPNQWDLRNYHYSLQKIASTQLRCTQNFSLWMTQIKH